MPASRFFALHGALRWLRNQELTRACYISRASAVSDNGFDELVNFYDGLEMPKLRPPDVVVPRQEKAEEAPLKGEDARLALFQAFSQDRRVAGNRQRRPGG